MADSTPDGLTWEDILALMQELRRIARGALRRHGPADTSTTELLDTTLRRMFQGGDQWDYARVWENRAHVFGSFRTALENALADHYRRQTTQKRTAPGPVLSMSDLGAPEPKIVEDPALFLDLKRCLETIALESPEQAEALEFSLIWGFELREMAALLGITESEARGRVKTGLDRLRRMLTRS